MKHSGEDLRAENNYGVEVFLDSSSNVPIEGEDQRIYVRLPYKKYRVYVLEANSEITYFKSKK